MRSRSEVIARIKACLKYADPAHNTNEHERATAKKLAEDLIEEHGITRRELGVVDTMVEFRGDGMENLKSVLGGLGALGIKPKRGWEEA